MGVMTLDISLPSGALGSAGTTARSSVSVARGRALAVSYLVNGRSVISVMHINAWLAVRPMVRRADRSFEDRVWKKR
jgi:hypothetical protein